MPILLKLLRQCAPYTLSQLSVNMLPLLKLLHAFLGCQLRYFLSTRGILTQQLKKNGPYLKYRGVTETFSIFKMSIETF